MILKYDGNGNTGGVAPTPEKESYNEGEVVIVADQGTLVHNIYKFKYWMDDNTGNIYTVGSQLVIYIPEGGDLITLKAIWGLDEKYRLEYSGEQLDTVIEKVLALDVESSTLSQLKGLEVDGVTLNQLKGINVNIKAEQFNTLVGINTEKTIQQQLDSKVNTTVLSNNGAGVGNDTTPVYFDKDGVPHTIDLSKTSTMRAASAEKAICDENGLNIAQNYARKSRTGRIDGWLLAENWNAGAKTYPLEDIYPSASYAVSIELSALATLAQYKAWCKGGFTGSTTTTNITALNKVPSINIPVIFSVTYIGG